MFARPFFPPTMPKSKRSKVTSLTKTPLRTTKASKLALANELKSQLDQYDHVWLFDLGDMRNEALKELRVQWRGTGRFIFGRARVMAKALGESVETEHEPGLSQLAEVRALGVEGINTHCSLKRIKGSIGLFMTSWDVDETREWFDSWNKREYARLGATAERDITLPAGELIMPKLTDYIDQYRTDSHTSHRTTFWRSFPSFYGPSITSARSV